MASHPLTLSDPNLLAEFVRESAFKTFFEKRFAAPPDLAALLFRNGELINSFKGAHFSVGGLATALKGVAGGSTHISIMLADLKPFSIQLPINGLSADNLEVMGLATLELQLNPDKPSNILGLMGGVGRGNTDPDTDEITSSGRRALSRIDVLDRIAPHFTDRVIEAALGRVNAEDIRGDRGLQDKIQADMMTEADRICGDLGLLVRNVSVEWALNDAERDAMTRANIARQQDALDLQLDLLKREVARQSEATQVQMTASVDLARLEAASEDELATMVLNSEVSFLDAREAATRRQEMEALAHEIEILRTERAHKMETDLADASHLSDLTQEAGRLRRVERDIEALDTQHTIEMKKIGVLSNLELKERAARIERDIRERDQALEQRIAKEASAQSHTNLRALMDIEHTGKDRDADRSIKSGKADTDNELARIKADADARTAQLAAGAKMTPEQIMAINAGLSPDVADVLKEQARNSGQSGQETMETMRELIQGAAAERDAGRAHELNLLKAGMAGATGVARGAGGKSAGDGDSALSDDASSRADCPKCGRTVPAKANFCTGCGHKMRT